ncbi:hypothetical protein FACS1894216_21600 [Synergistales bacterium]|nr:hypothetical protein FACS1894216_21600 [Synergistales bacterium]
MAIVNIALGFIVSGMLFLVIGAIVIAFLCAIAQTVSIWAAVVFGVLLVFGVISGMKRDKKIAAWRIMLKNKEHSGELLTRYEYEAIHPDESWKLKYPGYYRPKD